MPPEVYPIPSPSAKPQDLFKVPAHVPLVESLSNHGHVPRQAQDEQVNHTLPTLKNPWRNQAKHVRRSDRNAIVGPGDRPRVRSVLPSRLQHHPKNQGTIRSRTIQLARLGPTPRVPHEGYSGILSAYWATLETHSMIADVIRTHISQGQRLETPGRGMPARNSRSFTVGGLNETRIYFDFPNTSVAVLFEVIDAAIKRLKNAGGQALIGGAQGWADPGTFQRFLQNAQGNAMRTVNYVAPVLVECGIAQYAMVGNRKAIRLVAD